MMKKTMFLAFLVGMIMFSSCSKDEQPNNPEVPTKAQQELLARYPEARNAHWDVVKGYHVARFNANKARAAAATYNTNVWFTNEGNFCQTDEDIEFDNLPEAVRLSFNKYKEKMMYQEWTIDDCEALAREGMSPIFVIEIENGELEREISISESGDILKDVLDDDDEDEILPVIIPEEVKAALQAIFKAPYDNFDILEYEEDDNEIEIDVLAGNRHVEVELNAQYESVAFEYKVSLDEAQKMIDEKVFQNFAEEARKAGFDINDVTVQEGMEIEVKHKKDKGFSFEIEIELNDKEFEVEIDEEGNMKIK